MESILWRTWISWRRQIIKNEIRNTVSHWTWPLLRMSCRKQKSLGFCLYFWTSCYKTPKEIFNDLILRATLIATLNKFNSCQNNCKTIVKPVFLFRKRMTFSLSPLSRNLYVPNKRFCWQTMFRCPAAFIRQEEFTFDNDILSHLNASETF